MTQSYGIDVSEQMSNMLAAELAKSIDEEIILDLISPETKHITDKDLRRKIIKREQQINKLIDDDNTKPYFDI